MLEQGIYTQSDAWEHRVDFYTQSSVLSND